MLIDRKKLKKICGRLFQSRSLRGSGLWKEICNSGTKTLLQNVGLEKAW